MEILARTARAAGMPRGQLIRFLEAGYVPQPKQVAFHVACRECDAPDGPTEVGFGGARGPGKSHALLAQMALDDCQRAAGLKCLLLRKVGKAVREAFEDMRSSVLARTPHDYNKSSGTVKFPNGSRIIMGHFKNDADIDNYLGLEYDLVGVEEATTLSASKYRAIRTCNRTARGDWRPRMYTNANPGGVGHGYYKRRFILPWREGTESDTRFIGATVDDNAFVNAGYRRNLELLSGWKKRAWLEGDWDIAAGQFFTNFCHDEHVVPATDVPAYWPFKWLAMDYGWTHPTAVVLLAKDNESRTYLVDEYRLARKLPAIHVENIRAMLGRWGLTVDDLYAFVGGADMWKRDRDGRCVADEYLPDFPLLEPADMSRVAGASTLLTMLGDPREGMRPTLYIFDNCTRTVETLTILQHDQNRPEDVMKVDVNESGEGGDDLYDALRYGLMAQPLTGSLQVDVLTW